MFELHRIVHQMVHSVSTWRKMQFWVEIQCINESTQLMENMHVGRYLLLLVLSIGVNTCQDYMDLYN